MALWKGYLNQSVNRFYALKLQLNRLYSSIAQQLGHCVFLWDRERPVCLKLSLVSHNNHKGVIQTWHLTCVIQVVHAMFTKGEENALKRTILSYEMNTG